MLAFSSRMRERRRRKKKKKKHLKSHQ